MDNNTKHRVEFTLNKNKTTKHKKDNILTAIEILLEVGIKSKKIIELGFQKIGVDFDTREEANSIVANTELPKLGLTANVPYRYLFRKGVI